MPSNDFNYKLTIDSLEYLDHDYARPAIIDLLKDPKNLHLLKYVSHDAFGAHVFPGNISNYPQEVFLGDIDQQLQDGRSIHLWANIPLCESRCHFCQFPIELMANGNHKIAAQWVDANIAEARLWLQKVPRLASAPIGEFNIFGGTPSLLSISEIKKLVNFYKDNFYFTDDSTLRFEGNPKTLTKALLEFLAQEGFTKLSFGVQSFDDDVLYACHCPHITSDIFKLVNELNQFSFDRVSIDLIYGLLDQSVASVERDILTSIDLDFSAIVCSKLHLRTFSDSGTSVSGTNEAAWQKSNYREKLIEKGSRWPALGEQYQMREALVNHLDHVDYFEHPTMYFTKAGHAPEKWKAIMADQDKQHLEIAVGLGGSSSCVKSQSTNTVDKTLYFKRLSQGKLPIAEINGFDLLEQEKRSVKMALSTCQPLLDEIHQACFPNSSLFDDYWQAKFKSLQERNLVFVDELRRTISLTKDGKTLVEAIINTEF